MQVRNLLIAAGATLAGLTAIAAAPTAASAQVYDHPGYHAEVRHMERVRHFEHRRWARRHYMAVHRFHHPYHRHW